MFKLLRDAIFYPKNIIHYRAKSTGFVVLYMLLVSLIMALSTASKAIGFNGMEYENKIKLADAFEENNSYIMDGKFYSDKSFIVELDGYSIGFIKNDGEIKDLKDTPAFVVKDNYLMLLISGGVQTAGYNISELTDISENYRNLNLKETKATSACYVELDNFLMQYKPLYAVILFFAGLIDGIFYMLGFALITYIFLNMLFKANKYMKKGQLFKMLIFASTLVVFVESFTILLNLGTVASWLALLVSFIPLYVLEKEIAIRIRMKELGQKAMDNQSVIDKINEMINNKLNDEDNDDNNDDNE